MQRQKSVYVVTGAAQGIGAALVRLLAAAGHQVLVTDRDADAAAALADRFDAAWMELDVTRADSWADVVDRLETEGAVLRGVALNAGVAGLSSPEEFDQQLYRTGFAVNVDGVVNGLVALYPLLRRAGGGSVVVTASLAGLTGVRFDPFYTMTKHAVIGLVRSVADDFNDRGVSIQAVCPGLVDTELLGDARETITRKHFPLLDPEQVAGLIAECFDGGRTDLVTVLQPGREPIAYRFAGVPGPADTTVGVPPDLTLGRRPDA